MNPLRSVGARLSLALLLVVAGSLALVYLVVIPTLQSRLVDSKIHQLELAKPELVKSYRKNVGAEFLFVQDMSAALSARVAVFNILARHPLTLDPVQDSRGGKPSTDIQNDPVSLQAAQSHGSAHGTVTRGGSRYAEMAFVGPGDYIIFVSASLGDSLDAVSVAKQRILIAGGLALVLVLVIGYVAASMFARRIRRLERAADRIASGSFDEPIVDHGQDEIGQLARGFERMRQRLSQLDRARREFIANASHELRTPIFSLGGFLELFDDEELDPATRAEFLATMRDQVRRLSKLATELLDLSRLDAGQIEIEREPLFLGATARLVVDEFVAVARQTDPLLSIDTDEDAVALGDEMRVVQIVRNLIENALVHTPPRTKVHVEVARGDGVVTLSVADDGPGVPAEQVGHVFERFYRGDGSTASGSGLGLAIALELTRVMGGKLELQSRPGRTEFLLTLPSVEMVEGHPREPSLEPAEV